jgi:hypothetical protein
LPVASSGRAGDEPAYAINDLISRQEYQDKNLIVNLYDLVADVLKDETIFGMAEDPHGVLVSVEEVE